MLEKIKIAKILSVKKLNKKNLFKIIKEYEISVSNMIWAFSSRNKPGDFESIKEVKKRVLMKSKINLQPRCKETLYIH